MTARDRRWRVVGAAVFAAAGGATHLTDDGSPLSILFIIVAAIGLLLLLNGKKVAVVYQAERYGHRDTADAIRAGRRRRQVRGVDQSRR